jgi:riboflavin synthase
VFTGIVEELGRVDALECGGEGAVLSVTAEGISSGLRVGVSVAVSGVCLTVTRVLGQRFWCDLSPETLSRTSLGGIRPGAGVNLERPLAVGGRLGGHFVLGHVDGVGTVLDITPSGDGRTFRFGYPHELARYLVWKGSIAVDGISLTLAELDRTSFSVAIIPHTLRVTNLAVRRPGDCVNLEVDVLGKYFERYVELGRLAGRDEPEAAVGRGAMTVEYLKEQGF